MPSTAVDNSLERKKSAYYKNDVSTFVLFTPLPPCSDAVYVCSSSNRIIKQVHSQKRLIGTKGEVQCSFPPMTVVHPWIFCEYSLSREHGKCKKKKKKKIKKVAVVAL